MSYCDTCDRWFHSDKAFFDHRSNSSRHCFCRSCERDFASYNARRQHYINSTFHNYCEWCEEDFDTRSDLEDHDNEEHYECSSCNRMFRTEDEFDEHNEENHWYCSPCRRVFRNENNLNQHLNSGLHKPKAHICPGRGCGRGFVSWGALVLHFESGACPSGLNRHQLNKLVVRYDRNNIITNPSRLITGPGGAEPSPVKRTWATQRSWNGGAYECFLCHREFGVLDSLNRHLQSPAHENRIYRCPNRRCETEYSALSALTQHVESGGCGVNRFKDVRDIMDSLTNRIRTITL